MLAELNEEFNEKLLEELQGLSKNDKQFFSPHAFDSRTIRKLSKEQGNHYYIYLDGSEFIGYGMLRTFGRYDIPTLGDVIWQRYRQKGHGSQLVRELLAKAHSLGFKKIRLTVSPENKIALEMYNKVGFKQLNTKFMEIDIDV